MSIESLAREIIGLDSTPSHSCLEVTRFIRSAAQTMGLEATTLPVQIGESDDSNVLVTRARQSESAPGLLLHAHLDTSDPGHYGTWTQSDLNPFFSTIHEGKIFGLGAAQGKLDFIAKLVALSNVSKEDLSRPIYLAGTCGAERPGMQGVHALLTHWNRPLAGAIVGLSSEMNLVRETRGLLLFDVDILFSDQEKEIVLKHSLEESTATHSRIFKGRAAHSSCPEAGESALKKLLTYMEQLPEKVVVVCMEAGTAYNVVPGESYLEIDVSQPCENHVGLRLVEVTKRLEKRASEFSASLNFGLLRTHQSGIRLGVGTRFSAVPGDLSDWLTDLKFELEGFSANITVRSQISPYTSNDSLLFRVCQEELDRLALPSQPVESLEASEASLFSEHNIPTVLIGPGKGPGNSHAPNEYVKLDELHKATAFYEAIIRRFCK